MKKQYTLYLEPAEPVEDRIIDVLESKLGGPRQRYLRDILTIGYLAKEAGYGAYEGKLLQLSGAQVVGVLKPNSAEAPITSELSQAETIGRAPAVAAASSQVQHEVQSAGLGSPETKQAGSGEGQKNGLFANLRNLSGVSPK